MFTLCVPLLVIVYTPMASVTPVVMDTCDATNGVLCCLDQSLVEPEVDRETISI